MAGVERVTKRTKATTRADRRSVKRHRECSRISCRSVEKKNTTSRPEKEKLMIRDEVEIDSGHWCNILVNKRQNHKELTDNAGSGNGAEVKKLATYICRWQRKNLLANRVVENVKSRRNLKATQILEK